MRCRYRSSQSDSGLRCCGFIEPKASSRRIDRGQQYFEPGHWVRDVTGPILQHLSLGCPFAGCGTLGQAARHVFVQHAGNGCLVRDAFFPCSRFESGQFALGGNRLQLPFLKGFQPFAFVVINLGGHRVHLGSSCPLKVQSSSSTPSPPAGASSATTATARAALCVWPR